MTSRGFLLALGLSTLAFGCASQPKNTTFEERFQRADANNDGKVTRQEYGYSMIEDVFARTDKSKDGTISLEEFVAIGGSPATFKKMDVNGDGQVTIEEAKGSKIALDAMTIQFYGADTDKDGYVTLAEALAYREKAREYTRGN